MIFLTWPVDCGWKFSLFFCPNWLHHWNHWESQLCLKNPSLCQPLFYNNLVVFVQIPTGVRVMVVSAAVLFIFPSLLLHLHVCSLGWGYIIEACATGRGIWPNYATTIHNQFNMQHTTRACQLLGGAGNDTLLCVSAWVNNSKRGAKPKP